MLNVMSSHATQNFLNLSFLRNHMHTLVEVKNTLVVDVSNIPMIKKNHYRWIMNVHFVASMVIIPIISQTCPSMGPSALISSSTPSILKTLSLKNTH